MSVITSIQPQVKDNKRCNVYVDGKFYCGIKLEIAVKYHLKAGTVIEKERLDEIQLETEKSQALDKAFSYLAPSLKTEKQIRQYLVKKGYVAAVVDYCLEKLKYYGYVNDEEYCRQYVSTIKGKGGRALKQDLKKRGASDEAIEAVFCDYEDDADEAFALLQKYMRGKERDAASLNKGYKYLISRGYGYDAAKSAVDKLEDYDEDDSL